VRLYGLQFELRGDPLVMADNLVLIDAIDRKSGESRRVPIPLTILNMARADARPAA